MHGVTLHKTCRNVQVTQGSISFVIFSTPDRIIKFVVRQHGLSKAMMYMENGFLATFSKKRVLQMFKNVMKVREPPLKLSDSVNARLIIHIIEGLNQDVILSHTYSFNKAEVLVFCFDNLLRK